LRRVSTRQVIGYGALNTVAALPIIPIAVLLPSWYAANTTLGLLAIGSGLTMARLVDFFSDPLVGILVDRSTLGRWRYKPWIMAGTAAACVALFALATPPVGVGIGHIVLWAVVLFTGWTMIMVPYTAWGAELAVDPDDRSRLTASREVAGIIGIIAALSVPALLAEGDNMLLVIACTASILAFPALAICFSLVRDLPAGSLGAEPVVRFHDLLSLLRFRPMGRTMLFWVLNSIANSLPAVLFPIIVTGYFGLEDKRLYQLLLIYFGSAIALTPLWLLLAKRLGKLAAWRLALTISLLAFLPVLLLRPDQVSWFVVICIFTGGTLAADLALPPSIQADVLESDRELTGSRRSGAAFALWSMATKLALAAAVGGAFIGLHFFGVEVADGIDQAESLPLLVLYVAIPVLLKLAVVVMSRRSPFDLALERQAATHVPARQTN